MRRNILMIFCSIYAIILLLFSWFYDDIINIVTPFLMFIPFLILGIIFLILLVGSIICLHDELRKFHPILKLKASIPLLILAVLFVMEIFVPFTKIKADINFAYNFQKRNEVVSMILKGKIKNHDKLEDDDIIELPEPYRNLSQDGLVSIEKTGNKTIILFYDCRGILDNFSGFFYISNNDVLKNKDMDGDYYLVEKKADHWYYGASS